MNKNKHTFYAEDLWRFIRNTRVYELRENVYGTVIKVSKNRIRTVVR